MHQRYVINEITLTPYNPYAVMAILLHVSMHVLPIFLQWVTDDSKKNILQWCKFSV